MKIIGVVVLVVAVVAALPQSDLRKAFLDHQKYEYPEVKAYFPQLGGESFVLSERWKNYQKTARSCPAIAEVVTVEVSKTTDGGEFVIRMKGPNYHEDRIGDEDVCSLWVRGSFMDTELPVRDISPY